MTMNKLILLFLILISIGCFPTEKTGRVFDKGTESRECQAFSIIGQNDNFTVYCPEKIRYYLKIHTNFGSHICYVNKADYEEIEIGLIFSCKLK